MVDLFENPPAEFAPTRQLHPDFDVREGGHRQALLLTEGHHLHGLGRPAERPQRLGCFTALLLAPGSPQKMRKLCLPFQQLLLWTVLRFTWLYYVTHWDFANP